MVLPWLWNGRCPQHSLTRSPHPSLPPFLRRQLADPVPRWPPQLAAHYLREVGSRGGPICQLMPQRVAWLILLLAKGDREEAQQTP